jgi:hypothetical protein
MIEIGFTMGAERIKVIATGSATPFLTSLAPPGRLRIRRREKNKPANSAVRNPSPFFAGNNLTTIRPAQKHAVRGETNIPISKNGNACINMLMKTVLNAWKSLRSIITHGPQHEKEHITRGGDQEPCPRKAE